MLCLRRAKSSSFCGSVEFDQVPNTKDTRDSLQGSSAFYIFLVLILFKRINMAPFITAILFFTLLLRFDQITNITLIKVLQ